MQKSRLLTPSARQTPRRPLGLLWLLAIAFLFFGCTARHYRNAADKQVYGIIQDVERRILGYTNDFTIDTHWSGQDPQRISPEFLIDSRSTPGVRNLTIENALALAVAQNRRYQAAKETLYISALNLTAQRHNFRPNLLASSTAALNGGVDENVTGAVQSRASVSQLLKNGGSLGVNLVNDLFRYYVGDDPLKSAVSAVSVNLAQPLLRGFGPNNPEVEALTQAERDVVYAVRTFTHFQNQFSLDIVNRYFTLLAQRDDIRNRYTNYLGRVQATRRLEARSHDREALSGVDQARQSELSAKNTYINTIAAYRNLLDAFKIELGLTLDVKLALDDTPMLELEAAGLLPAPLDPDQAYRFAVERHLLMLNSIDQFEDAQRRIRVAANRLKPELNLFASATVATPENSTDYTRFDIDQLRGRAGLTLNLPLDRLNERNAYRRTLINFETQIRNLTLDLDDLKSSIQGGLRTLEQRRQNYDIQTNALALANRRVASTTMSLEAGRAEVRDLLEAQDAQITSETAVTRAIIDYQQARLELMLNIGALQTDSPKFWLQDHLPDPLRRPVPTQTAGVDPQPVQPPEAYFTN